MESSTANESTIRIGTRGSALALWQANWVADQLRKSGVIVDIIVLKTTGDVTDQPLNSMGGVGVFTKAIQIALLNQEVDLAVHSLKDLPTEPTEGLLLAAVPPRESVRDVLVSAVSFSELANGAVVGTGSIRRQAQLLNARPDLQVRDIRGNVDTRLRKLESGDYDAIVLAEAGLRRLELDSHINHSFDFDVMLPAVGQGALGIETRSDDERTVSAVQILNDEATHRSVLAERTLLAQLRAGCLAPVGAHARMNGDQLMMDSIVLSADGTEKISESQTCDCANREDAVSLGASVATKLLSLGAERLINRDR